MTSPSSSLRLRDDQRSTLASALVGSVAFTAVLWVVQLLNALDHQHLDRFGVEPRSAHGLLGIAFAPSLHASWSHLLGNTVPALVLLFLVLATAAGEGVAATAVIWVTAGVGVWLVAPSNTDHLGASSLIFGWLVFLVARGIFTRSLWQIALGVLLFVVFGALLVGVLPGQPGISWQGHLFGSIGGALAALLVTDRPGERSATDA